MTRLKKLLLAGSMAVVTCCVSLSSSILNVSSLYAHVKANAETTTAESGESTSQNFNNTIENSTETTNGKIITVSNIPSSVQKSKSVYIPATVFTSTVDGNGKVTAELENPTIILKNPYGVSLLGDNGEPLTITNSDTRELIKIKEDGTTTTEGVTLTDEDKKHPNSYKFTPAQIGTYTVQYAVNTKEDKTGVWTSSNIYNIDVSAEQFSIEFVSNDPIIMPDKIDTSTNLDKEDKHVNLTLPIFYNGNGKQIKNFVLETDSTHSYYIVADYVTLENVYLDNNNSPVLVDDDTNGAIGKNVYEKYSTYQIRKLSKADFDSENLIEEDSNVKKYAYSVAINTKVSTKPSMSNSDSLTKDNLMKIETLHQGKEFNANTKYNYVDYAYYFEAGNGLNFVEYRLYETENTGSSSITMPLSSISKSISGSTSYKRDNINIGVSVASNIRSSATSIGKKTYLPAVNTVDKNANKNTVPAYYYYKVAYVDSKDKDKLIYDDETKLVMGIDEGGVYFIPKVDGTFNIYYNAQDFYFDKVTNKTDKDKHTDAFADDYDYDVTVSDRSSPDMYLVDSYEFDKTIINEEDKDDASKVKEVQDYIDNLKSKDISYTIPTKYSIKKSGELTKITIPAIYTEDNFKKFSDLRVFRSITSTNGFKVGDEVQKDLTIRIQDGSSTTNPTNFSTSLSEKGIFIDDIISFDFINLPKEVYYAQGNFYDTTNATEASEKDINDNHLAISNDKTRVIVLKTDDSNTEDTSKRADGKYYVKNVGTDDTPEYKIFESKIINTSERSLDIKKWKSSAVAIITVDPRLFSEGEYTVEFRVTDGVYSNNTGDKFTFTLVDYNADEELDKEAPEVKFTTATTLGNVGTDEEISIAKPRVTDDVDSRILVRYYVEVNNIYKEIELDSNNKLTFRTSDKIGDDGKTIYELASSSNKKINVVAIAYDDFAGENIEGTDVTIPFKVDYLNGKDVDTAINGDKHIGYAIYPISIKYVEDSLAPIIYEKLSLTGVTEQNFKQGDKVLINGITYFDNTQNAYLKSIKVVDSDGNVCASQSLTFNDFKTIIDELVKAEEGKTDGKTRAQIEAEIRKSLQPKVEVLDTSNIPTLPLQNTANNSSYIYKYTFPGISFIATESKNYTITYEVCDMGTNNVSVFSFVTAQATDTQAPIISGVANATNTIELGQTYNITSIKITDNNPGDITLSWEVKGAKSGYQNNWLTKQDESTFVFTPQEVDVYTITLTAIDEKGNASSKSFVVTVKDTSKPTIELNNQYETPGFGEYAGSKITIDENEGQAEKDQPLNQDLNGNTIDWANKKFPSVNLPGFSAKDKYQELGFSSLGANGNITIRTPDDDTYVIDSKGNVTGGQNEINLKMKSKNNVNYFTFTPTKRGHYTATYSATDLNGNTAEKTEVIDIYVGDTEVPVIYLTDALINKLNKGFVVGDNDLLVINPDARIFGDTNYSSQDIYVSDNYGFNDLTHGTGDNAYKYASVSISVTNENNSTIRQQDSQGDGKVRYKFDTAGTYTITFTVTDECGNTGTYNRTFVVTKDRASSMDTTKIVGIVLIVASVLILGGVVIYFIKGTKFLPKRKKNGGKDKVNKKETPSEKQD